jgi:hypothetical protein
MFTLEPDSDVVSWVSEITYVYHHDQQIDWHGVKAWVGLESKSFFLAFHLAGIIGIRHCTQLQTLIFK